MRLIGSLDIGWELAGTFRGPQGDPWDAWDPQGDPQVGGLGNPRVPSSRVDFGVPDV